MTSSDVARAGSADPKAPGPVPLESVAGLLEDEAWFAIRRDLRRRDSTALRVMLGRELDHVDGPDGEPAGVDRLLRIWARFSQAVYDENIEVVALDAGLEADGESDLDWDTVVSHLFAAIVSRFPPADTLAGARCRATFAVFVYAETVVFWEYSVVPEQVRAMRKALTTLAATMPAARAEAVHCRQVARFATVLMDCLVLELSVESAMASCAVQAVQERSAATRDALSAAQHSAHRLLRTVGETGAVGPDPQDPDGQHALSLLRHLQALLALVLDDLDGTLPYFELLAEHVAPASQTFLDNLRTRTRDADAAAYLAQAAEQCRSFEESAAGQWSVFASEARAHRIPLEAATGHCRDPEFASLELIDADVTYLYPFGLPVAATGSDVLPELMAALESQGGLGTHPISELAGTRVVIDDAPRSDGWLASTSIQERDYRAFRAVFPDHELALQTSDGVTFVGLDVDVRLSGMGNHYVRIRMGTDTRTEGAEQSGWSPHDLEQAIRRGGQYSGPEKVWFRARTPGATPSEEFGSVLELATRIVSDLAVAAHTHVGSAQAELSRDLAIVEGFLARYCQVLVMVSRANAVRGGGVRSPLVEVADLQGMVGIQTALMAQRALAQSALEWVAYPPAEKAVRLRRVLAGRIRRELIWCSGDVTAVFNPTAPHWQTLVTRALVEFSSSLIGVFWRRQQWLRRVVDESGQFLDAQDPWSESEPGTKDRAPEASIAEVEAMEARLSEAIRHVQLLIDRAGEHSLSRDQQGREIAQHLVALNGVAELQHSLDATVQAAVSSQRFIQERLAGLRQQAQERAAARRQRPLEVLVTVLAVLGLIDLFGWFNDTWGLTGDYRWWIGEFVLIIMIAAVVWWLSHRAWSPGRSQRARAS